MGGPEHKQASKTEWGYFVGLQWPMCLVFQDNQILSVSRKKLVCHEGMYANFDPTTTKVPNATIQELDTRKETNTLRQELLNENTQPGPHTDEQIYERQLLTQA
jgi:hypothetical protein